MTYTFSIYDGPIRNVKPKRDITLVEAMKLIQSDVYKERIEQLRNETNKDIKNTLKKTLPYFTFSGTFRKRITDNLKQHSGLIVLDFDNLSPEDLKDFKHKVITIEWVCAAWISPSGNGLKVLVKIDPKLHYESFVELAAFFEANFCLDVDQSGKDVARACFVSWDPDLYYNPDSEIYKAKPISEPLEMVMEKSVRLEAQEKKFAKKQFKHNKDLRRAEYVVEQIEREQWDLTSDYDNWQLIAFALATFGEDGRELFHRVSQFHPEYSRQDADAKFNDALNKGRFKTPAKFFSLASDYGLDVKLPRTLQEAQRAADAKQVIGDDEATEDYLKYGIYENKKTGTYFSLDQKGIPREISNFNMHILFHIATGSDEAFRMIQIKNIYGLERVIRVNTDDFVSAGSFKKVIARVGNFIFKGQDSDLVRLQDMLQRHEKHTEIVDTLGWNKRGKFYAFANGIYDTEAKQFLPIDKYGIVEKIVDGKQVNYFLPALSIIFSDKEDKFVNEKKFILKNSSVKYEDWATQFVRVFGQNGKIGVVFWICALFSDVLFKAMGRRMPMPFGYGKRGSGKGTFIQSLSAMWGDKQDQIMLGGATTVVGFMRKMAQFCNAMVWLDEYKNNLNVKVIESLKNLYDRIGYERGKKDNSFTTESTPILSSVFLSGQEMPTIEAALFTRCILMTFNETKRTEDDRVAYRNLVKMEEEGLSHLSVEMLQYRTLFELHYQDRYERMLKELSERINNNDVDERLLSNYAMLLATADILQELGRLPFSMEEFTQQCQNMLLQQFYILKGSDDASKFWQVVEQLFNNMEIHEGRHFMLKNGYIYIRIQDIYQQYVEAMIRRKEVNVLDKATLENYLMSDSNTFVKREKKQFGGSYRWCLVFHYAKLGIDLIRVDTGSEYDLKAKYREMNIEYEEEEPSTANAEQVEFDFFDEFIKK